MRFNVLLLLCLSMLSVTMFAQYGTEREKCRVAVIGFPKYAVPNEQRTFFVDMISSKKVFELHDLDASSNDISFWGWSRVYDPAQAHMMVTVDFGALVTEEINARYASAESKDFLAVVDYTLPIDIKISTPENTTSFSTQEYDFYRNPVRMQYVCDKKFPSRERAISYIKSNKELIDENIIHTEVAKAIKKINNEGGRLYAFDKLSERVDIYHLDSKKSEFFDQQENDYKDLITFFNLSSTDRQVSPEPIKLIIEHYKNIISKLDDADKKQKNAKRDLIITVANLYYVIENFGESEAWAHKLMENYDEKEGKNIIEKINKIKDDFARFGVQSRHFAVQSPAVDNKVPTQNASAGQQPAEKVIERVVEKETVVEKKVEVPIVKDIASVVSGDKVYNYKTLKEAFEVAQTMPGNVTVKLLDDALFVGFYNRITIRSGNITFEMNGKSVYGNAGGMFLIEGGNLTVEASGGSAIIMNGDMLFTVTGGTLTLNGGTYMSSNPIIADGGSITLSYADVYGRMSTLQTSQTGKIIIGENCKFSSRRDGSTIDSSRGGTISLKEGVILDKFVYGKGMVEVPLAQVIKDDFGSSAK